MAKAAKKKPARKSGGSSTFSQKMADRICQRIAEGMSLRAICKSKDTPAISTVCKWLVDNKAFSEQYARAREEQAEKFADEIVEIADETPETEPVYDRNGELVELKLSSSYVAWQKNRIDARKWVAAKLKPKKYGDKVQTEITGADGGAIEVATSNTEIAQRAAFLLAKAAKAGK